MTTAPLNAVFANAALFKRILPFLPRLLVFRVQANEVERLVTWYNPLSQSDLLIPGEDDILTWRTHSVSEKQYRELARLAWDISPELAVYLPDR